MGGANEVKKLKLTKVVASSLIAVSLLALNPIGASAEWRQNRTGWWYAEGSSYSTGWKLIDGKYYYFSSNGYMMHDTYVEGYELGPDGAWVVATPTVSTTTNTKLDTGSDPRTSISQKMISPKASLVKIKLL